MDTYWRYNGYEHIIACGFTNKHGDRVGHHRGLTEMVWIRVTVPKRPVCSSLIYWNLLGNYHMWGRTSNHVNHERMFGLCPEMTDMF